MALLCALSFLTYFDRFCIIRAQGEIQRDLGINDARMGIILGAFWLAYGLFEIPGGWLGDRFGSKKALVRIVLAWSLFTALSGSATGFLSLLTFRFLFGVGEAGAYPNMARVQSQWLSPRERARMGGLLWLFARWGGAFSPAIFGAFLRATDSPAFRNAIASVPLLHRLAEVASWRMAFWVSGLLGIVWVLIFLPFFREDPAKHPSLNRAELDVIRSGRPPGQHAAHSHHMPPGVWLSLFTSRSLWAIALLYLFGSFGWSFFASWMPRFYKEVHGVPFARSELMSGMPLFFGGLSCLVGGTLSDLMVRRTGRKRLWRAVFPIAGYSTAAIAMIGIPFVKTPWHATVLLCVANGAFDFGQGANWASIVDIGGAFAGTATGFINMVGNMGNFIQPVIGQWIFNTLGWGVLFGAYAAAFFVAASMWAFIDPNQRFYKEQPAPERRGFEVVTTGATEA
jgi:MFS transporter, ACS family, glucarate transporter